MSITRVITIQIPPDDDGFIGRECPSCQGYFKLRPGTGLQSKVCYCPYCQHQGNISDFTTSAQKEWAKSLVVKEIVESQVEKITQSLRQLEKASSKYMQIRVTGGTISLPISSYNELEVETRITCEGCGLEFAVFGVFTRCPDCAALNFLTVFSKSLELCRKRLAIVTTVRDDEIVSAILQDSISSAVSSFDALGKAVRRVAPGVLTRGKRNLFQDLDALSIALKDTLGRGPDDILGESEWRFMRKMFQVRHVYQHNLGVIDDDAIRKIPELASLRGRIYPLTVDETTAFIEIMSRAGPILLKCIADAERNRSESERKG